MSDLISRQAAIDDLKGKDPSQIWDTADIEVWINTLPSAQSERKRGKWINSYKRQTCSVCKQRGYRSWSFCPNCGSYNGGGS